MIRVNLLQQAVQKSSGVEEGFSSLDNFSEDAVALKEIQKQFFIRILVVFIGPIGLYLYESNHLAQLRSQEDALIPQVEELRSFNANSAEIKAEVEKFKEDETKIQARIGALNKLSGERLNEIKMLDFLQQIIPEKVWLSQLDFRAGQLLIAGYASANDEISKFQEILTKSAFLKNVTLASSKELVIEDTTLRQFEINAAMEMSK